MKTKSVLFVFLLLFGCKEKLIEIYEESNVENIIDEENNYENNIGEESNVDNNHLLGGTKWKLAGIIDVETEALTVLEPKECDNCYTIIFDNAVSDCNEDNLSSFSTYSSSNSLGACYEIDYEESSINIFHFGGTKRGEIGDGNLWWYIIPIVQSFALENNQLRLYYNDNTNYLLFKQIQP